MIESDKRFAGAMGDEYRLIYDTHPHLHELQRKLGDRVRNYSTKEDGSVLRALELGCGDGYTSHIILKSRSDLDLTAVDSEPKMVASARLNLREEVESERCKLIESDALTTLISLESDSLDIVASAMTLHNLLIEDRAKIHEEIYRVLKPGALFVNVDKYTPEPELQHQYLRKRLIDYFEYFVPLGKLKLLEEWVLHEIDDAAPNRIMKQADSTIELQRLGFTSIEFTDRTALECLVVANK